MGWSASIRVMNSDDEPAYYARVTISFSLLRGIDTVHTDEDGWANFDYPSINDFHLWVSKIWINGIEVDDEFYLDDGETRSYTLPSDDD